jgi:EB module
LFILQQFYPLTLFKFPETLEISCFSNEDCSSYEDKQVKSVCTNRFCECIRIKTNKPEGCTPRVRYQKLLKVFPSHVILNFQQVSTSNKIGDSCPCGIPNSQCLLRENFCACLKDFVVTPDELRCIKQTVPLNQSCEMNEQCVKFDQHATCSKSICQCLENFTMHDNSCRSVVKVGEKCESHAQCRNTTTNVSCFEHTCACDQFYVASKDGNVSWCRNFVNDF